MLLGTTHIQIYLYIFTSTTLRAQICTSSLPRVPPSHTLSQTVKSCVCDRVTTPPYSHPHPPHSTHTLTHLYSSYLPNSATFVRAGNANGWGRREGGPFSYLRVPNPTLVANHTILGGKGEKAAHLSPHLVLGASWETTTTTSSLLF